MAIWTLPNLFTFARILVVPFIVWRLLERDFEWAFWLFAAAAVSDLLDGSLARLLNQRSELGAWLDPIADKLVLLSTLLLLAWDGLLPIWFAALVLTRDSIVLGGAAAYRSLTGGLQVAPSWLGKAATMLEFVLVSAVLAEAALQLGLAWLLPGLFWVTAVQAAASGLHYVWLWSAKTYSFLRAVRS
ncbi:MAG: CDP-alcohol phosphatidyltransferase family protein [Hydrogenophilaceae bacterium]|nr:CDP-alcohol phosphatidyltransferase family protein [Hydrogenophilaceae bacterium]